MSTVKPRITITLDEQVYEVVRRLSAAGGDSMSRVITQFLDVAVAPMERMVVVLEQAQRMPSETTEAVRASILRAEAKLLPKVMAAVVEQEDLFLAEWRAEASGGRAAEPRGRPMPRPTKKGQKGLLTPVHVTRGAGRKKAGGKVGQRGRG